MTGLDIYGTSQNRDSFTSILLTHTGFGHAKRGWRLENAFGLAQVRAVRLSVWLLPV